MILSVIESTIILNHTSLLTNSYSSITALKYDFNPFPLRSDWTYCGKSSVNSASKKILFSDKGRHITNPLYRNCLTFSNSKRDTRAVKTRVVTRIKTRYFSYNKLGVAAVFAK